ncbi:18173_t:CDS:1, partial [Racocetra fulgida]
ENHKDRIYYRDATFPPPNYIPRQNYHEEEIVKDSKSDESGSFSFFPNSSSRSENQVGVIALKAIKLTSSMGDSKISEISMNIGQQSQQSNNLTDSSQRFSEHTNSNSTDDQIGVAVPYTPSRILSDDPKISNI